MVQINGKKEYLVSQNSPNEEELIEKINNDKFKKYIDKRGEEYMSKTNSLTY